MTNQISNPPSVPITWYVFQRSTGKLIGAAVAMRAYDAWEKVGQLTYSECWVVPRTSKFKRWRVHELERLKRELDATLDRRDWSAVSALEAEIAQWQETEPNDGVEKR